MQFYFWPAEHAAGLLALTSVVILLFAWPAQNVPICAAAGVMMAVAVGIALRTHMRAARLGS
ncbi:MAG TPA: hypothetical protein VND95_11590 [Stellaceae bacterium]|nr:hypothetical protein [Stellaceae bacterium]